MESSELLSQGSGSDIQRVSEKSRGCRIQEQETLRELKRIEAKVYRIDIVCVWARALVSLSCIFSFPCKVVFHFSITAFVMTEYLKYRVRIIRMTSFPQEPDVQILGSHYFIIVLPSVVFFPYPFMSDEEWIQLGRLTILLLNSSFCDFQYELWVSLMN